MSKTFTDYNFWPIKSAKAGNLVANGQVTVLGTVVVNFGIVKGKNGLFPSLPSDRKEDKSKPSGYAYYPKVRFPDDLVYQEFQKLSVEEYEAFVAKQNNADPTQGDNSSAGEGNQAADDSVPF